MKTAHKKLNKYIVKPITKHYLASGPEAVILNLWCYRFSSTDSLKVLHKRLKTTL